MGRASRIKRERRTLDKNSFARVGGLKQMIPQSQNTSPGSLHKVYRFFKDASHADDLVSGNVWISTLEVCRAYEDPLQGDPNEATHEYNSGPAISGSYGDAAFNLIAARSGIHFGPGSYNNTISNNTMVRKLHDAFVLCTTEHFKPEVLGDTFGMYCVEISNPLEFFRLITTEFPKINQVKQAAFGRVIYRKRSYMGLEDPPGPIGFVKPPDIYQDQSEVRFLWTSNKNERLQAFLLHVPSCAALCKRIA